MFIERKNASTQYSPEDFSAVYTYCEGSKFKFSADRGTRTLASYCTKEIEHCYSLTLTNGNRIKINKPFNFLSETNPGVKYPILVDKQEANLASPVILETVSACNKNKCNQDFKNESIYISQYKDSPSLEPKNDKVASNVSFKQPKNLKKLEDLLCRVFRGDHLTMQEFNLSIPELHILVEIFIRKNRNACHAK